MICILALAMSDGMAEPAAVLIAAVSVSAGAQILSGKLAAALLIAGCSVLCGIVPTMFCAVPLLLYDALCEKKWWLVTPAVTVFAGMDRLGTMQFITVLAGMAVAVIMYVRISRLETSVGELRHLRNMMTENNMLLSQQNERLAQSQNDQVHIATLKERNRIAREIHDNVGHMLTRSLLMTGALQVINKDEALKEPLDELKNTLDGAMTSIRSSVHDLHDDSIDLKKTIEDMLAPIGEKFRTSLSYDAGAHIPGDIKLCVAGIVREGVSNAVKHSDGDRIDVVFREHPAFWQLLIEDNGSGKKEPAKSGGIGLRNMEDRAASVGGRISFTHEDGGFRIFLTIPKEKRI